MAQTYTHTNQRQCTSFLDMTPLGYDMSDEAVAKLRAKQDRQGVLRVLAPGTSHDAQARRRQGVGVDVAEPMGHEGPISTLKGSVARVDQARSTSAAWLLSRLMVPCFFIVAWKPSELQMSVMPHFIISTKRARKPN